MTTVHKRVFKSSGTRRTSANSTFSKESPKKIIRNVWVTFFLWMVLPIATVIIQIYNYQTGALHSFLFQITTPSTSISEKFLRLSEEHTSRLKNCNCKQNLMNCSKRTNVGFLARNRKYYLETNNAENSKPRFEETTFNSFSSKSNSFMVEMLQSEKEQNFSVCKFHKACILRDGALLLHHSFKRYSNLFRKCAEAFRFSPNLSTISGVVLYSNDNLYGASEIRKHIPLFLTDVIPSIYANELLGLKYSNPTEKVSYRCFMANDKSCSRNTSYSTDNNHLNALHAEEKVQKFKNDHWVIQFTSMLFENSYTFSTNSLFKNTSFEMVCFNSIISYTPFRLGLTPQKSIHWENAQEKFFSSNGLQRSISSCPSKEHQLKRQKDKQECAVHVVIINRRPGNESRELMPGRDLVDIEGIEKRIIYDARRSSKPKLLIHISVVYFEEMLFAEQVHIMQMADVIVGVHGAALANLIFAKKGTPILEVFPFFYFPIRFEMLSRGFSLNYSYMFAEPDPRTYFRCINHRSRNGQLEDVFVIALDTWREAIRRRSNATEEKPLNSSDEKRHIAIRSCARSQRLKIDIAEFSSRIVNISKAFCMKRKF